MDKFDALLMLAIGALIAVAIGVFAVLIHGLSPENRAYDEWVMRDAIVRDCLESETYSREECITLAGEAK